MDDKEARQQPSNGGRPDPRPSDPKAFNPETLDKTLISLELIAEMQAGGDDAVVDVIIDANLDFPSGRDDARARILGWLRRRLKNPATAGSPASPSPDAALRPPRQESLDEVKGEFSAA